MFCLYCLHCLFSRVLVENICHLYQTYFITCHLYQTYYIICFWAAEISHLLKIVRCNLCNHIMGLCGALLYSHYVYLFIVSSYRMVGESPYGRLGEGGRTRNIIMIMQNGSLSLLPHYWQIFHGWHQRSCYFSSSKVYFHLLYISRPA